VLLLAQAELQLGVLAEMAADDAPGRHRRDDLAEASPIAPWNTCPALAR